LPSPGPKPGGGAAGIAPNEGRGGAGGDIGGGDIGDIGDIGGGDSGGGGSGGDIDEDIEGPDIDGASASPSAGIGGGVDIPPIADEEPIEDACCIPEPIPPIPPIAAIGLGEAAPAPAPTSSPSKNSSGKPPQRTLSPLSKRWLRTFFPLTKEPLLLLRSKIVQRPPSKRILAWLREMEGLLMRITFPGLRPIVISGNASLISTTISFPVGS
jgi:hypothetical protein